ncbi:hypothetical protein BH20ACT10_BH20ACT10_20290 [soil metagenome]
MECPPGCVSRLVRRSPKRAAVGRLFPDTLSLRTFPDLRLFTVSWKIRVEGEPLYRTTLNLLVGLAAPRLFVWFGRVAVTWYAPGTGGLYASR